MGDNRKGYKGFDKGLICKGKQYAENTDFEESGGNICEAGMMHYCPRPLDVLAHYAPCDNNGNWREFAEVEALDDPITDDGRKYATKKLHIGAKISFGDLVKASVRYDLDKAQTETQTGNRSGNSQTGNRSGNSQTGFYSGNSQTGDYSGNSQTGFCSGNSQTGFCSGNSQTGFCSGNSQTGDYSGNSQTGFCSGNSQTGNRSGNSQTGNRSGNSQTGDYSHSEQYGKLSASVSTGSNCRHEANGAQCIAVGWGRDNMAKGAKGSYIVLAEYFPRKNAIKNVVFAKIDGKKIKADTWYKAKDGQLVEVEDAKSR